MLGVFAVCQYFHFCAFLQVLYAARDAQVSVAVFFHLLGFTSLPATPEGENSVTAWEKVRGKCQGLVDIPFRGRKSGSTGEEKSGEGCSPQKTKNRKSWVNGQPSGNQQMRDPRRQKRKPLGVGYSARWVYEYVLLFALHVENPECCLMLESLNKVDYMS